MRYWCLQTFLVEADAYESVLGEFGAVQASVWFLGSASTLRKFMQHMNNTRFRLHDVAKSVKWGNGAKITEEEALAEQQRMFAEARARMNGGAVVPKQPDPYQSLESLLAFSSHNFIVILVIDC